MSHRERLWWTWQWANTPHRPKLRVHIYLYELWIHLEGNSRNASQEKTYSVPRTLIVTVVGRGTTLFMAAFWSLNFTSALTSIQNQNQFLNKTWLSKKKVLTNSSTDYSPTPSQEQRNNTRSEPWRAGAFCTMGRRTGLNLTHRDWYYAMRGELEVAGTKKEEEGMAEETIYLLKFIYVATIHFPLDTS